MRLTIRRELRFLRVYATINTIVLALVATAAFRQATPQKFGHITVERMDVVDTDGTLRMVISNKDRMHPGVMDGKTIDRKRSEAGLIFFNDEGDEVGGLTFAGRQAGDRRAADASFMFDQLKQDQTIGLKYMEGDGRRSAGLFVWDRPDTHLSELIEKVNAANRIQDRAEREKAMAAITATAQPGAQRVFVGKNTDRAATVTLADANGKPRLTLTVDAAGNPRIEFLDEHGKVISRLP